MLYLECKIKEQLYTLLDIKYPDIICLAIPAD